MLTLWDFAGQHLYYASHSVFLSGRAVYILVYNLNKNLLATAEPCVRQGIHDILLDNPNNETNLDNLLSWLVSVHNIRSDANKSLENQGTRLSYLRPPVIIVGTHSDQPFEEVKITEKQIKKNISDKAYVEHIMKPFFALDNRKENNEGVQKLRQKIMEVLNGEPYMGEEVPLRYEGQFYSISSMLCSSNNSIQSSVLLFRASHNTKTVDLLVDQIPMIAILRMSPTGFVFINPKTLKAPSRPKRDTNPCSSACKSQICSAH